MIFFAVSHGTRASDVKRVRNEGTLNVNASNVMGNGNISAWLGFDGGYNEAGLGADPVVGVQVGIGNIMQFLAVVAFQNFQEFGPAEGHLQITMPRNDRLRLLGIGVVGDLFLTTSHDTITPTTDPNRPKFSPFFGATVVGDIDWLARFKRFPLKTYFSAGLADNSQLLFRYNQLAFKLGLEWKMYRHSIFLDAGTAFYREKRRKGFRDERVDFVAADTKYEQYYVWIEPGGRYRIRDRFSILGGVRVALYQHLKDKHPLQPKIFGITLKFEAPLFFSETNTEAIRTLVFMEQAKEKVSSPTIGDTLLTRDGVDILGTFLEDDGTGKQIITFEEDQALYRQRREDALKKMEEIERLLEEIE